MKHRRGPALPKMSLLARLPVSTNTKPPAILAGGFVRMLVLSRGKAADGEQATPLPSRVQGAAPRPSSLRSPLFLASPAFAP